MSTILSEPDQSLLPGLEKEAEQNFCACYQCGKCTADCPFSLTPHLVMRFLQLGRVEEARALATTWDCASCYTCATGCPKGVSPARAMKALRALDPGSPSLGVFTARAPRARHVLRSHVLGAMPAMFRIASRFAPVSNWATRIPGLRLAGHYLLGFHKSRPLPPFARPSFPVWFRGHAPEGDGHRGRVLLFHDTAMDFNYPQVGMAATQLLERAGFRVELTDSGCCGRPFISKGLDKQAAGCARNNIPRLYEQVKAGVKIVGCEPSCLLTLRDEYLHLAPELHEQARVVGNNTFLLDEFLGDLAERGELELKFQTGASRPVLFHGHCHQKAFAHPARSLDLLRGAGFEAEMVNAACCGMAGAHGYEREHYELSRAAGERALFPALEAAPEVEIVVMGVSCRQQIEHFTGRRTLHLAEILRDALEASPVPPRD